MIMLNGSIHDLFSIVLKQTLRLLIEGYCARSCVILARVSCRVGAGQGWSHGWHAGVKLTWAGVCVLQTVAVVGDVMHARGWCVVRCGNSYMTVTCRHWLRAGRSHGETMQALVFN